jgi:surface polysaccharide O-acyltransferase-like enzyme
MFSELRIHHYITGTFLDLFPSYIGFFIAGYYLMTSKIQYVKPILAFVGFIVSGLSIAWLTGILLLKLASPWDITYSNLNPFVIFMTICLFYGMQNQGADYQNVPLLFRNIVRFLSPLTLGIYLIHPFIRNVLEDLLWGSFNSSIRFPLVEIPVRTVEIFLLSAFLVAVIKRIPIIRLIV